MRIWLLALTQRFKYFASALELALAFTALLVNCIHMRTSVRYAIDIGQAIFYTNLLVIIQYKYQPHRFTRLERVDICSFRSMTFYLRKFFNGRCPFVTISRFMWIKPFYPLKLTIFPVDSHSHSRISHTEIPLKWYRRLLEHTNLNTNDRSS